MGLGRVRLVARHDPHGAVVGIIVAIGAAKVPTPPPFLQLVVARVQLELEALALLGDDRRERRPRRSSRDRSPSTSNKRGSMDDWDKSTQQFLAQRLHRRLSVALDDTGGPYPHLLHGTKYSLSSGNTGHALAGRHHGPHRGQAPERNFSTI